MNINLSLATELSGVDDIIGIYPGRFQVMGRHHMMAYEWLSSNLGRNNTFIATSNRVQPPDSPFSFEEKKQIAIKHGVYENCIIETKSPYRPIEVFEKYNPQKTSAIVMLGAKDYSRIRFEKKDGSLGYYQPLEGNEYNMKPIEDHAYVVLSPHYNVEMSGFDEMSGTALRLALQTASPELFEKYMGWYDSTLAEMIQSRLMYSNQKYFESFIETGEVTRIINEVSSTGGNAAEMDDGPRFMIGNRKSFYSLSNNVATQLGFSVVNYLMPNKEFEVHSSTEPPNGPVTDVSYFPSGVNTGVEQNHINDLPPTEYWKKWSDEMEQLATMLGQALISYTLKLKK